MVNLDEKAGETGESLNVCPQTGLDATGAGDRADIASGHDARQPLHHLRQHDQALLREAQGCQQ